MKLNKIQIRKLRMDLDVYKNYLKMTDQEDSFKDFIETYSEDIAGVSESSSK